MARKNITVSRYADIEFEEVEEYLLGSFYFAEHPRDAVDVIAENLGVETERKLYEELVSGAIKSTKTEVFVGIEKYEHGGSVYALCRQGHFPDRKWDVTPLAGYWRGSIDGEMPEVMAYLENSSRETEQKLKEAVTTEDIAKLNAWSTGAIVRKTKYSLIYSPQSEAEWLNTYPDGSELSEENGEALYQIFGNAEIVEEESSLEINFD